MTALAKEFADSGFDIKHLIRGICNSEAYQRTSKPVGDNRDDRTLYSHQSIKVLTGEQLFDSLTTVLGAARRQGQPDAKGRDAEGRPAESARSVRRVLPGHRERASRPTTRPAFRKPCG